MVSRNWSVLFVGPDASWLKEHIVKSLETYGCTVNTHFYGPEVNFGMGRTGDRRWNSERDRCNADLVRYAGNLVSMGELDVVFFVAFDDFLLQSTMKELKAMQCYLVNYHVDLPTQWYRILRTAHLFDLLAVAHKKYGDALARKGANVLFLPMAAMPPDEKEVVASQESGPPRVSFVGYATPFRRKVIGSLVRRGLPIKVYGKSWLDERQTNVAPSSNMRKLFSDVRYYGIPRLLVEGPSFVTEKVVSRLKNRPDGLTEILPANVCNPGIPDDELRTFYRTSSINLGINGWAFERSSRRDWGQVRLRDFEIPMAGGFYLAQAVPELDCYFHYDEEIVVWRDLDELAAKISYFLDRPQEAENIRVNGQLRALREHKWENRWDSLFDNLSAIERS